MRTPSPLPLLALAVALASSRTSLCFSTATGITDGNGYTCAPQCTVGIADGDVTFDMHTKYEYEFNGHTAIVAPTGTEDGISELSIKGSANIIGIPNCGAILYLKRVEITQGSKVYLDTELEGSPIQFSYNNGKVGASFGSSATASVASFNLKRAILSALQVSSVRGQNEFLETDVQGTCNTVYSSSSSGAIFVTKDKDLTQCTGHQKIGSFGMSSSQSNPANQDSPFSSAVHHSDIQIQDSTITSVDSQDTFLYQPLGDIDVVTKIMVSMNLNLKKKSSIRQRSLVFNTNQCLSIGFETPPTTMAGPANAEALVAATQLAMTNLDPTIDMDGAKYFADLIALLKVATKDDILSAFRTIDSGTGFENKETAQKVYIDALIAANCGESIEAVAILINEKVLSDSLAYWWLSNLVNADHPTIEAVHAASSLLNENVLKESYMGVGALLRKYLDDTQDYNSLTVRNILNNLGAPLQKACDSSISPEDQDFAIASLKGLGNAQYINSDIEDSIVKIIMDEAALPRIRAAALDMVKIYAQNSKVEKACENILLDASQDSELRIMAFKVFAINPSNYKATVIKDILDDKKCQIQIRAFLLSYLNNLQTTTDENKLDQKAYYGGIKTTPKKMLNDILRYSQSLEFSYQCPLIHSSVLLDTDVIYSYNSFLARSSSVSLKACIFRRNYNIFDFSVRAENVESMLEKLFGPEGYFTKNNGDMINDAKNYVTQAVNYAKNRGLNNVRSDLLSNPEDDNSSVEDMKKMYLDIGLKVFNKDLGWFTFQGSESQVTYQNLIDAILDNFDNLVPDKTNIELNIRKQLKLMDYEKRYATCSGLPVSLKIQATSAVKLNTATKFDLDRYLKNPENTYFSLKLIPSGSLTLNTLLTVDGSVVEVGNKMLSSIHTSTGFDSIIEAVKGRGVKMDYELPLNVMDVLSMKSEAFATVQEKESPLNEVLFTSNTGIERRNYENTFDDLSKPLGLSLNVKYDFPWNGELKSLLPFSGPSSFSFKVLKADENLTKYIVRTTYIINSPTTNYINFIFSTPRADLDRDVQLYMGYSTKHNAKFITKFKTPFTEIILQSTLVNSDEEKTLQIKYMDGSQHIFNIGAKCEKVDGETMKYVPVFDAAYSTEKSIKNGPHSFVSVADFQGYVLVKHDGNSPSAYPSELTLKDLAVTISDRKHSLQGSVSLENNELKGDGYLTSGRTNIRMNGYIGGYYPAYKMGGTLNLTRNEPAGQQLLIDESDNHVSNSKFMDLLYKIKSLNLFTAQELHVESPYALLTDNKILWDNDHFKIHGDILFENDALTMYGDISTSNLLDLVLNANITALPSTEDSGINVRGVLEHSFVSNPSNSGHGHIQFVQDKDKKGNHFEINSECPQILGVFNVKSDYQTTYESLKYKLNYKIHDNDVLNADMTAVTGDIKLNINYDSPVSGKRSSAVLRGWSEKENAYEFNSKILWSGSDDLTANGKVILDGIKSNLNVYIDFPLVNLVKAHLSLQSEPNPEEKDGGLASLLYVIDEKTLLSERFKYKLTQNDGELFFSGENYGDLQNLMPIYLQAEMKNYQDQKGNTGKEYGYTISLENNDQKLTYQRSLKVINNMLNYRQLYKINDEEQINLLDLEHDIKSLGDWSYYLKAKIVSPSIFHFLKYDNHNLLEFNSFANLHDYDFKEAHVLKIHSSQGLADLYEFRLRMNNTKSALKMKYGDREIRKLSRYSLTPINGGHQLKYSGVLWLDYSKNPNNKSSLSIDSRYSLDDGLSAYNDINILLPTFNDKEMGVKSDVEVFKSWENPFDVKLDLNIFPTPEQTLQLHTSVNRNVQDNGVMYSAQLLAESDGMKLNYLLKESIFVSSEKWGKYFDGYFIDSDGVTRPVQLHSELVSGGFINKLNVFDIMVISVDSSINVKDALDMRSTIIYNNNPYSFGVLLTTYPSFKYEMTWNDKTGVNQKLSIEGSIIVDDSAVISCRHSEDGKEPVLVGTVKKSLSQESWWKTDSNIESNSQKHIMQSLRTQFMERFINIHSCLRNIVLVAQDQRDVRMLEAKQATSQYYPFVEYTREKWNEMSEEIWNDDYILESPFMGINFTKILLIDAIDFVQYVKLTDSFKNLNQQMNQSLTDILNYYSTNFDSFRDYIKSSGRELLEQAKLTLLDILNMLNRYTNKPMNDMSSEPRSLNDYSNDVMDNLMNMIEELKRIINKIQDMSVNYINNHPIYEKFQNQIETLKLYPYKEKLCEEIHKLLNEMELAAPTDQLASFINVLDKYINKVINDMPVTKEDVLDLRNKGLAVAKSMVVDFPEYVDYSRAMSIYNALCKLTRFGKTVLYVVSPDSFQYPNNDTNAVLDFNEYTNLYRKYISPYDLLPPYEARGVVINSVNVITYNGRPYSFMPGTGRYLLAKDFVNSKFSVLANYNDNVLTSISLLADGETYELLPGGNIILNGDNVDFPLTRDNVKAWKDQVNFGIDHSVGVSVECAVDLDIVKVIVNGYYYGHVNGLLGAMFQDPVFDFKLPNGKQPVNKRSFVAAYEIEGDTEPTVVSLARNDQLPCRSLFSGVSTLKPCFSIVSPAPYRAICNHMVSSAASEQDGLDKACLVAKAYATMAIQNRAQTCDIPDTCVTTAASTRTMSTKTTSTRTITTTTNVQTSKSHTVRF